LIGVAIVKPVAGRAISHSKSENLPIAFVVGKTDLPVDVNIGFSVAEVIHHILVFEQNGGQVDIERASSGRPNQKG
jgi:hypothetical protein